MTSVNTLVTLLEAFFNIFLQTHRYKGIALPLLRMRVGVTNCKLVAMLHRYAVPHSNHHCAFRLLSPQ